MMSQLNSSQKAAAGALGALALATVVATVMNVEARAFAPSITQAQLLSPREELIAEATGKLTRLRKQAASAATGTEFVLSPPAETGDSGSAADPFSGLDYLRFTGTVSMSDGSRRALVEGSGGSAAVGSIVRGCLIKKIQANQLVIEDNGVQVTLTLNEKYYLKPSEIRELKLDRMVEENGQWTAVFSGRSYRAGEWIDSQTRILAVSPSKVIVKRNNQQLTFSGERPNENILDE